MINIKKSTQNKRKSSSMLQTTSYCRENLNISVTPDRWTLSANVHQVTFSSVNLTADYSHQTNEHGVL